MKKKLLAIATICLWFAGAQAQEQEDKLTTLLNDREQLVLEYQFYNQQNSNFWGKKSKKDLLNIIDTLKEIIRKDSELIGAIKEASVKKIAESAVEHQRVGKQTVEDQRIINARFADLQGQVSGLRNQIKMRERTILELEEQLRATDEQRYGKDKVIAILAVAGFVLLLYAVFLQVRLNGVLAKKKAKN